MSKSRPNTERVYPDTRSDPRFQPSPNLSYVSSSFLFAKNRGRSNSERTNEHDDCRPNAFCSVPFPLKNTCICDRPKAHVICKRCGYECEGRVQLVCDVHPTTLSLMDLRECANPICRSIQIFESAFSSLNDRTTTTDSTENANSSADQQQQ
ncbi:unnamed protein product [Nippostrongylus brasiliensis]|uniref:Disintegrin domain-containing protein n=1 Tax=Nippostrongylus brasiliensis TaxID=27835 RepID=A0A0N4YJ32_NIPBR|nr:unnamed protein product [Nippostrongylus brasiliensis]